jgi:colicin import membrane protein
MLTERTSYFFGASGSMLLHLLVIALALVLSRPDIEQRQFQPPQIIHATLVEMQAKTPEPVAPQQRVIDLTRRQPPQAAPVPRAQPTATPRQTPPAATQTPPKPTPVAPTASQTREAELPPVVQREQDFTTQLQAEATAIADQANQEQVMSYSALIEQKVASNWSRPPSARRGMVVELSVSLVPTGRVANVEVVRSSGDVAFDRSATQAVLKAEPFDQLQKLPSKVFEDNFRNFRFRFSPDDLRL